MKTKIIKLGDGCNLTVNIIDGQAFEQASHKVTCTIPSTIFSGGYAAGTFDFWVASGNKPYKSQEQGSETVRDFYGYAYKNCVNGGVMTSTPWNSKSQNSKPWNPKRKTRV